MQEFLDSAEALLSSEVELESLAESLQELDEICVLEKNFAVGLKELKALDPLLEDFVEEAGMSAFREGVQAMQKKQTEVKQQLDAFRRALQRCVPH